MNESLLKNPLISVILPVYNIQEYLPKCKELLVKQTYENIEFILVDDGSTDKSGLLCDQYAKEDKRFVVYHKKNGGLSDARNFGINNSKGEYITCVDPDDYIDQDYVQYLFELIMHYQVKMSICQHKVHFPNGKIQDYGFSGSELMISKKCIEKMMYHDLIDTSAWAKLYHRSLFDIVQYPKGKIFEDIGTTYALMLQCDQIAVGFESKYHYIIRNNSIVNAEFNPRKLDLLEMTDKMAEDVLKVYPDLADAVLRRRVYARFSTLNQMLHADNYQIARKEIINFILQHGRMLNNPKVPKRDKIAYFLLQLGYPIYKVSWGVYLRFQKGNIT